MSTKTKTTEAPKRKPFDQKQFTIDGQDYLVKEPNVMQWSNILPHWEYTSDSPSDYYLKAFVIFNNIFGEQIKSVYDCDLNELPMSVFSKFMKVLPEVETWLETFTTPEP